MAATQKRLFDVAPAPPLRYVSGEEAYLKLLNSVLLKPVQHIQFVSILGSQPKTRPVWMDEDLFEWVCNAEYTPELQLMALGQVVGTYFSSDLAYIQRTIVARKKPDIVIALKKLAVQSAIKVIGRRQVPVGIPDAVRLVYFCTFGLNACKEALADFGKQAKALGYIRDHLSQTVPLGLCKDNPSVYLVHIR